MSALGIAGSVHRDAVKTQMEVFYVFVKLDTWPMNRELTALVCTMMSQEKATVSKLIKKNF